MLTSRSGGRATIYVKVKHYDKIKVKSDGQECPSHTCNRRQNHFLGRDSGGTSPDSR